jgi:EAL domain-containing protein (putative c-di-GMP-specific phosphodiesterase class I)
MEQALRESKARFRALTNLSVVADGVETIEQTTSLRKHMCDQMQGFYFSKPVVSDEFVALLRDHVPSLQN